MTTELPETEIEWPCTPRGQRPLSWAMDNFKTETKLSEEQGLLALSLHKQGASYTKLGVQFNASRHAVRSAIDRARGIA